MEGDASMVQGFRFQVSRVVAEFPAELVYIVPDVDVPAVVFVLGKDFCIGKLVAEVQE